MRQTNNIKLQHAAAFQALKQLMASLIRVWKTKVVGENIYIYSNDAL